MAVKAQLRLNGNDKVRVKVANGEQTACGGSCIVVPMLIQATSFTIDVFVLVLASCNVVLGVQWLQTQCNIL